MAGSLPNGPDSHNPKKIKQGAPNLSGHIYQCAGCLEKCPPFMPDGCTMVPVCQSCWKQIGLSNRLTIITFTRNTKAIEGLTAMIQEYLNHRGIMVGKMRPGEDN
jgi:hypothetical protein